MDLDGTDGTPEPVVSLRPMSAAGFGPWIEHNMRIFAAERAQAAGLSVEASLAEARAQIPKLLPQGMATPDMRFMIVVDSTDTDVGSLWLGVDPDRPNTLFVWDMHIDEQFRRRGIGRAAMKAAEGLAREVGATAIGLHVFGHNTRARSRYESLGYEVSSVQMVKAIAPE